MNTGLPQRIPMHLLYTVNAPIIGGLYSGLPQRIPMHLLYTVNAAGLYRVTSAYTIASSLYGELMHLAIIAGLYSGLPQRIPQRYIQGYQYQCIYFIRTYLALYRVTSGIPMQCYSECTSAL